MGKIFFIKKIGNRYNRYKDKIISKIFFIETVYISNKIFQRKSECFYLSNISICSYQLHLYKQKV